MKYAATSPLRGLSLVASGLAISAMPMSAAPSDQTTLIRELAKNKTRVVLIVSGPQAEGAARTIQGEIMRHRDNQHAITDLPIVPMGEDAVRAAAPEGKEKVVSILWILARNECSGDVSPDLASSLPVPLASLKPGAGALRLQITSAPKKGGTAYIAEMVAPDAQRLAPLVQRLMTCSGYGYANLRLNEDFSTYRLAVFSSPDDRTWAESWGRAAPTEGTSGEALSAARAFLRLHPFATMTAAEREKFRELAAAARTGTSGSPVTSGWTDYKWYSLNDRDSLPPEQLAEYHQVFFINRGKQRAALPMCVQQLLKDETLKETTTLIRQQDLGGGLILTVFSAPSETVLSAKAAHFRSINSIPGGRVAEEAQDLRHIGRTTLLVNGADEAQHESIRLQVAHEMRTVLRVPVEERGDVLKLLQREVSLEELQGATDTANKLRRNAGLSFIWLLTLQDCSGSTEYQAAETKLTTEDPPSYEQAHREDDPEPQLIINAVGGGYKDEYNRKYPPYKAAHDAWEQRKAVYSERVRLTWPCQWERTITCSSTAHARGMLRLLALGNPARPAEIIWERECNGSAFGGGSTYRTDRVTVRGVDIRPSTLDAPPNSSQCAPDLLLRAACDVATQGIADLKEHALLPDETAPEGPEEPTLPVAGGTGADQGTGQGTGSRSVGPAPEVVVAEVRRNTVAVTAGSAQGVQPGDRVWIPLQTRELKRPGSDETLRVEVTESITLRVINVDDKVCDCVPANAVEATHLAHVKVGMKAKMAHPHPSPAQGKAH